MSMSYEWVGIAATVTMALLFVGAHLWPAFFAGSSKPEPERGRKVSPEPDPSLELTGRQLRKQAEVEWKREYELLMDGVGCECRRSGEVEVFSAWAQDGVFHYEPTYLTDDCPRHGHRLQPWW